MKFLYSSAILILLIPMAPLQAQRLVLPGKIVILDSVYFDVHNTRLNSLSKRHVKHSVFPNQLAVDFRVNGNGIPFDIQVGTPLEGRDSFLADSLVSYFHDRYALTPAVREEFGLPARAGLDYFRVIACFDTSRFVRTPPPPPPEPISPPHLLQEGIGCNWDLDDLPQFIGGIDSLYTIIGRDYPDSLKEQRIEGDVIIMFMVTHENQIEDVTCLFERPMGYGFGELGVNAIRQMAIQPSTDDQLKQKPRRLQQVIRFRVW